MRSTLGRLPAYLQYLQSLDPEKSKFISATAIAKALGLGDVQVRKDLSAVSGAGRPKVGYVTSDLIQRLRETLGRDDQTKAVIVGAGKLGQALLDYTGFDDFGVDIAAAFDIVCHVPTKTESGKFIYPFEQLEEFCRDNGVHMGVITVPACAAHGVCDKMIRCGITAIWNFAPCSLTVPDGVLLQQENLALSLANLRLQAIAPAGSAEEET